MRRSLAPSQLLKRQESPQQNLPCAGISRKRNRDKSPDGLSKYRKPLVPLNTQLVYVTDHEEILKKLSQPFKCPIPNYEGCNSTKNLGIRRSRVRRALYDPNTPNALVLYAPPELSQHEKMKGEGPALVHVVVDPALANILRPHQRGQVHV
jgi:hypothetical protein